MASSLLSLLGLGPRRSAPPVVPTDEVVPVHLFDDTATLRRYTLMWTFRFDDVLDADKLGNALSELFQMEGWRKLGGRIRRRPDGSAEIHIPCPFTEERPPLYFTKARFDMRMSEHPEASTLPTAPDNSKPATFPSPRNYQSLGRGPGSPACIDDYLYSDLPQFALHVVNFTDGTLVSINFNHIVSDLAGLMAIMNAWQLVLAGKPEAVPPFKGLYEDSMAGLHKAQTAEKYVLADKQLSGWKLAAFGLRLVFDYWWNSPIDSRLVCVPKKTMDALVRAAQDQVPQSVDTSSNGNPARFISENDIVVALVTKVVAQNLPPNRPITVLQAVDPRSRVKSVFDQNAAYVCNAPAAAFLLCSSQEAVDKSIGELALDGRKAIQSQVTEEQMKAVAVIAGKSMANTGNPPIFGESNMALVVSSNWSKAKFLEKVDFSPAIVESSQRDRPRGKPGHPVYYHSQSLEKGSLTTNVVIIMGRDLEGNFWMNCAQPAHVWPVLLGLLEKYA
ncbi:uncharacterized protein TrAFT101_000270 [Trichoderma asperellum]|uniref:Uncharacterized protein n=1 Tax=Trichoderma asperellum (strain ATCC 204424 / CBS 433.97 / NBRC 101777) TaxID=1042311 RepID=A0A2T3ZJ14_TRIA4|nr:hypothetical protein M441DRAFT_158011 [Trichoderma asperellum CBS 433.97]PTB44799.1 hypothetical protein M441DRAFT_158011 [Trichoderma asperellum CBS 433.97]UKZ84360.1 hypothetical protein TrAFT101_000270 [Trichoderma asperellum]